ncbi:MAG: helix-turn-helix transcriptional regulator, partial [Acidimicrobiales bacterium]
MSVDAAARLRQLLVLLPWLSERGQASIAEVSERFGIPEDELIPLLERAACCGLPPYTPDQLMELIVADGQVSATAGHHLHRPLRLSAAEGFALVAAGRALLAMPGAEEAGPLGRSLAKLEEVLGSRSAMVVAVDDPPVLEEARAGLEAGESLDITYYSAARDELTPRRVDPRDIYLRDGHWYLDGFCHLAGGLRHFRLDRCRELARSGERVQPPPAPPQT